MSEAIAIVLAWFGLSILVLILVSWKFYRTNWPWLTSDEENTRREADRVAKQATKEFKNRQRLRVVRTWNF